MRSIGEGWYCELGYKRQMCSSAIFGPLSLPVCAHQDISGGESHG